MPYAHFFICKKYLLLMHKYQNSFLFEESTKVKNIETKEGFLFIELEDTLFYPGGGGQPCDRGFVEADAFRGEVVEVFKENNMILHKVNTIEGSIKKCDVVLQKIDKERRTKLIRMHTGEHILFKSLEHSLGEISLVKINLEVDESSLFIDARDVTWETLFKAEELANLVIGEDRPVLQKEFQKSDAVMMEKLRIKADRIPSETVRVLEVKDFDWAACTGTHADSTGFVGNILITKFNQAKGGYEIRFKTNVKEELFELARIARETASFFGTGCNTILPSLAKLKEEADAYKGKFRKLSYGLLNHYREEKINNVSLIYCIVEEVEKMQLVDKSASLLKDDTVVCFVNKSDGKATVLLNCSPSLKLDIPKVLNKALSKFNGKGGGKENFAMGSAEEKYAEDIINSIKEELKNL